MLTTPQMSSTESSITGTRVKPVRRASASAWRTVLARSIQTISVRGTITSRATVSPSSNTEWIISRSESSTTPRSCARSTSSRSSTSEVNGPSRKPWPGVIALPITMSSRDSGPSTEPSTRTGPATIIPTRYGCWRPMVRGPTPIST